MRAMNIREETGTPNTHGKPLHHFLAEEEDRQTRFVVKLTDNPGNYAGLDIEIKEVSCYSPLYGWVELILDADRVDVLRLTNGREIQIAHCPAYVDEFVVFTKIKFRLGKHNYLKVWEGNFHGLNKNTLIHSFRETEYEAVISIHQHCNNLARREILLDFDVLRSVKQTETGYRLVPHIREVEDRFTGLKGAISQGGRHVVVVTNYSETYTGFTNKAGEFLIRGMRKGIYTLLAYAEKNGTGFPVTRKLVDNIRVNLGTIAELQL